MTDTKTPFFACFIAGARPNFMKVAPVIRALHGAGGFRTTLIHTGQHYDRQMSDLFFRELDLPEPEVNLGVGSMSHVAQLGEILIRLEPVLARLRPHMILVVGDVNSTLAGALAAAKMEIPLAHIEAGLRSFDRSMPEETNRMLTDALAQLLFVTEPSGVRNLQREGIASEKVHLVGNVMIDTLLEHRERARRTDILQRLGVEEKGFAVATIHRPSNVDRPDTLSGILDAFARLQEEVPIVLPLHPRSRERIRAFGLEAKLVAIPNLLVIEPLGYLEFLRLMDSAALVLTDSGGIQEETAILEVPCVTLRENTERPITLESGIHRLVGADPEAIVREGLRMLRRPPAPCVKPALWDGLAASRIAEILAREAPRWRGRGQGPDRSGWTTSTGGGKEIPWPAT